VLEFRDGTRKNDKHLIIHTGMPNQTSWLVPNLSTFGVRTI
jgi:hypothetical protein